MITIRGPLLPIYGPLLLLLGLPNRWDSYPLISPTSSGAATTESAIAISNSVTRLFRNKCREEVAEKRIKVNLLFRSNMLVNRTCLESCMLHNCVSRHSMRTPIVISIIISTIIYNRRAQSILRPSDTLIETKNKLSSKFPKGLTVALSLR